MQEITNEQDPLTCLAALSLLKEQVEQASSGKLQSLLADFFLPHLEQLLTRADSLVKPMAMQVCHKPLDQQTFCYLHTCVLSLFI